MPSRSRLARARWRVREANCRGDRKAVASSSPGRSIRKSTRRAPAALFWKSTHSRPKVIDAPATAPNSPSTTMKSPGSNWPRMIWSVTRRNVQTPTARSGPSPHLCRWTTRWSGRVAGRTHWRERLLSGRMYTSTLRRVGGSSHSTTQRTPVRWAHQELSTGSGSFGPGVRQGSGTAGRDVAEVDVEFGEKGSSRGDPTGRGASAAE